MIQAVNGNFQPMFKEGSALNGCTQKLRDLVTKIQEFFMKILQTLFPCVFGKPTLAGVVKPPEPVVAAVAQQALVVGPPPAVIPAQQALVVGLPAVIPAQQALVVGPPAVIPAQPAANAAGPAPAVPLAADAEPDDDDEALGLGDLFGPNFVQQLDEEVPADPALPDVPPNEVNGADQLPQRNGGGLPFAFPFAPAVAFRPRPAAPPSGSSNPFHLFGPPRPPTPPAGQRADGVRPPPDFMDQNPFGLLAEADEDADALRLSPPEVVRRSSRDKVDRYELESKEYDNQFNLGDLLRQMRAFSPTEQLEMAAEMWSSEPAGRRALSPLASAARARVQKETRIALGSDGLNGQEPEEIAKGPFVCLRGLHMLWNKIQGGQAVTRVDMDEILSLGRANFDDTFDDAAQDQNISYEDVVRDHGIFDVIKLAIPAHRQFQVPRYPTLRYSPVDDPEIAEAAAGPAAARVPDRSSYKERIRDVILALQITAKNKVMQGALLFKGTQDNPKTYGVLVQFNHANRGNVYYLIDPYGVDGKISLHKFSNPGLFVSHFTKIAPGPIDQQEENNYWVMPLDPRQVEEEVESDPQNSFDVEEPILRAGGSSHLDLTGAGDAAQSSRTRKRETASSPLASAGPASPRVQRVIESARMWGHRPNGDFFPPAPNAFGLPWLPSSPQVNATGAADEETDGDMPELETAAGAAAGPAAQRTGAGKPAEVDEEDNTQTF